MGVVVVGGNRVGRVPWVCIGSDDSGGPTVVTDEGRLLLLLLLLLLPLLGGAAYSAGYRHTSADVGADCYHCSGHFAAKTGMQHAERGCRSLEIQGSVEYITVSSPVGDNCLNERKERE